MSEDIDSRRDDSGATAPAPRVAVEPTPQAPAGQAQPGPEAATPGAATQPPFNAGNPYAAQTQTVAHTVVKTKTKKLPVFLCSLAGMVVGAVLVVALIMTGALNVNRDAGTATATSESSGGSQTIKIDAEDTTLAEAVSAKALPSVVSITAWSSGSSENVMQGDDSEASGSIGSGVVLDTDGNILTNNHVVEGATDITVSLNGESYEAELVGADTSSDLAVIKLKDVDAKSLTPIEVGDSDDLSVGEWVMAIGSPFAIPSNYAVKIAKQIISGKTPEHAYLGVRLGTVTASNARQNDLSVNEGAYVGEVIAGSPADEAGIKKGDVVTKVNDEQISSADSLIIALRSYDVGDTVTLTVQRGKNEKKIDVKLGSDADAQTSQGEETNTDSAEGAGNGMSEEEFLEYLRELMGNGGAGR